MEYARPWFSNQSNPCPLHWECRVLTTGLPGEFPSCIFFSLMAINVTGLSSEVVDKHLLFNF